MDFNDDEKKKRKPFSAFWLLTSINEAYDSSLSYSSDDDEIDYFYNELYGSLIKARKDLKEKLIENTLLHERINQLEKENHDLNTLVERSVL